MSVDPLTVTARAEDDRWLVAFSGPVDLATRAPFTAALDRAAERGERAVVLDLTAVTFMGSTALWGLVRLHQRLREQNRDLRLVAAHDAVLLPLRVTGLDAEFAVTAP
ncbi:STAS domain-containing protein [Allokutzneria albata]|uniref:Anti-sigma factor antagonist n=1 Tax=Allokutzneria albata TaxID=211114 RepID=A0A1G9TSD8_ALLAB|nr:STAS domain-containing protein [Allokutzneria albata]SDM50617.1 anti-anti-sigma factor [Allokutzneria albata]